MTDRVLAYHITAGATSLWPADWRTSAARHPAEWRSDRDWNDAEREAHRKKLADEAIERQRDFDWFMNGSFALLGPRRK